MVIQLDIILIKMIIEHYDEKKISNMESKNKINLIKITIKLVKLIKFKKIKSFIFFVASIFIFPSNLTYSNKEKSQ